MAVTLSSKICPLTISHKTHKALESYQYKSKPRINASLSSRRKILVSGAFFVITDVTFNYGLMPSLSRAEEKSNGEEEKDNDDDNNNGIFGAIKSLLDPNEETKSGKTLPKAYLKSARDVVKNLRESLKEDPNDAAKFRRTADSAKESIRDYLNNWRGQQSVAQEESYAFLEKAIRSLASFYSKAGPSGVLSEEVKSEILGDLDSAEEFM